MTAASPTKRSRFSFRSTPGRAISAFLLLSLTVGTARSAAASGAGAELTPTSCADLVGAQLGGARATAATPNSGGTFVPPPLAQTGQATIIGLPTYCDVRLTETNADGVQVNFVVWLPATWNGRFQGVGGGGYACGPAYLNLAAAIQNGYASASTDCGIVPVDVPSVVGLTGP